MTREEKFNDYAGFVEKFKPKKTTDDCYTPPAVYEAVKAWACQKYSIDPARTVRPFWPGGDYEHFDYPDGAVVLDNPPFSCLAKIVRFYQARQIHYFLFAPGLTALDGSRPDPARGRHRLRRQPHHVPQRRSRQHRFCDFLRPQRGGDRP